MPQRTFDKLLATASGPKEFRFPERTQPPTSATALVGGCVRSGNRNSRNLRPPPRRWRGGNLIMPRSASLANNSRADMSLSCPLAVRQLNASVTATESRRRLQWGYPAIKHRMTSTSSALSQRPCTTWETNIPSSYPTPFLEARKKFERLYLRQTALNTNPHL